MPTHPGRGGRFQHVRPGERSEVLDARCAVDDAGSRPAAASSRTCMRAGTTIRKRTSSDLAHESLREAHTTYDLRSTDVGGTAGVRVTPWFSFGSGLELLTPRVAVLRRPAEFRSLGGLRRSQHAPAARQPAAGRPLYARVPALRDARGCAPRLRSRRSRRAAVHLDLQEPPRARAARAAPRSPTPTEVGTCRSTTSARSAAPTTSEASASSASAIGT